MSDVNDPKVLKAPIPEMTYTLDLEERLTRGKDLREVASRKVQRERAGRKTCSRSAMAE